MERFDNFRTFLHGNFYFKYEIKSVKVRVVKKDAHLRSKADCKSITAQFDRFSHALVRQIDKYNIDIWSLTV